ncbi:MAG: MFS transporter [Sphingomonadales bacterium RIFCSPHIGHO2_01_FULL_65_20]|uniref:MFS transporter n=1 Tax=Blastomonas sp. TaxID=1909299 RepID=UPI0008ADA1E6|nr:MHS family MFS transporter [Blastomonas sp.]OHC97687.1 MAG: MFS transporter [Sphingomonadales bacterium RIFCSPHIGHO2_01_FULL_65_20]
MAATAAADGQDFDASRDRLVIVASSLGTVFEWYDFFVYGILATLIGQLFFPSDNPTAATLASLAIFGAGFGVRPLGAVLFGYLGDKVGRKYTFLVTISLMGGATASIGLLPTFATAGVWAAALLLVLRCLQGLALGGEYGGAAIYVAEHAPPGKRGQYTSWIQASVAGGFLLAVICVLATRKLMTPEDFNAWGWRVPFLISILLLAISLYIRMKLSESPVFQAMKAAGSTSKNPFMDSLRYPGNIKRVMVALFGVAAGLTVIYYTSQFGTLYFLTGTARVAEEDALLYMAAGATLAAPLYVFFGWLSDRVGRKRLLLIGYGLTVVLLFPLFHLMAQAANPALEQATKTSPVTLAMPECAFNALQRTQTTECGKALNFLSKRGISYTKVDGDAVALSVGGTVVRGYDEKAYVAALEKAGYPDKSDPASRQPLLIILLVALMVALSAMTYGQVAAIMVELFPAKIRYTSMSIPYHIGTGYFGGFLPYISQYIVARTGDAYSGLWYTIAVVVMAFTVSLIWLPETSGQDDIG